MKWTEFQKIRISGGEFGVPWWVNDKIKFYHFCQEHDLPTPTIIEIWKHPSEINLTGICNSFVLKPSVMHSARGVMVLRRDRNDEKRFFDYLSKQNFTEDEIRQHQTRLYEECRFKGAYKIFVEEKVIGDDDVGEIPLDYKIFTFHGIPKMVFQLNRNYKPKRAAWFDDQFRPLRIKENISSNWKLLNHGVHLLPREWSKMLALASQASLLVRTPFISVDMYASTRGPLIGEMTPAPGAPYYGDWYKFTEEFDAHLGREWEEAIKRISETSDSK